MWVSASPLRCPQKTVGLQRVGSLTHVGNIDSTAFAEMANISFSSIVRQNRHVFKITGDVEINITEAAKLRTYENNFQRRYFRAGKV
jgi:hypothetical protein